MKNNQTYRSFAAFFLTALVLQVFVLQGLHHYIGHDHDDGACDIEGTHVHAEGHGHFSCDICLFHFAPTDLHVDALGIQPPIVLPAKSYFNYIEIRFVQKLRQSHLRGPPTV